MAYIHRWVGKLYFALAVTVLLSACGSQEVKFDNPINTPVLATQKQTVVLNDNLQQDELLLYEFVGSDPPEVVKDQRTEKLIKFVASRFKKPESFVAKIVEAAEKYAQPDFPKVDDILAIIAVESTYNTAAHHKGSWGLMQIEAKSHHDKYRGESIKNIDTNVRVGVQVLTEYYGITKSRSGAIQAYNIGIGSYLGGGRARTYLSKVNKEKAILTHL